MRLGAPLWEKPEDPQEYARAHVAQGYRAAVCPNTLSLSDSRQVRDLRQAFEQADLIFGEVGAWCNFITPDAAKRKEAFEFVCERLALADELGASGCVNHAGSLDPDTEFGPHPDNLSPATFDLLVEIVRRIIDEVKPTRTKFCLETMQWILPDSPQVYLDLIAAVDRPAFAVNLDPVNFIVSPRQYFNSGSLIRDCFKKLGKWIVSCHAKDIVLRNQNALHFDETRPGTGNLDYKTYLIELAKLPADVPLLLEHLSSEEEYHRARDYVLSVEKTL